MSYWVHSRPSKTRYERGFRNHSFDWRLSVRRWDRIIDHCDKAPDQLFGELKCGQMWCDKLSDRLMHALQSGSLRSKCSATMSDNSMNFLVDLSLFRPWLNAKVESLRLRARRDQILARFQVFDWRNVPTAIGTFYCGRRRCFLWIEPTTAAKHISCSNVELSMIRLFIQSHDYQVAGLDGWLTGWW